MIFPRYTRYILRNLLPPTVLLFITLTMMVLLSQSLKLIDLIVNRGLEAGMFLYLTALLIPSLTLIILPIASFLAVLFIYNKFINESEFIAFSATGLSHIKLAGAAIWSAAGVCALLYAVTFFALPYSYRTFKDIQFIVRNQYATLLLQEGVFNTPVKDVTVYVQTFEPVQGRLRGIFVHDGRKPDAQVVMSAEEGRLIRRPQGARFILINGNRQENNAKNGMSSVLYFDKYDFDIGALSEERTRIWREAKEYYVHEMLNALKRADDIPPKLYKKIVGELHFRISWPLFGFLLTILPLTALLTAEFDRRGKRKRVIVAAAVGGILCAVQFALKSLTVSMPHLFYITYVFLGILALIEVVLLRCAGFNLRRNHHTFVHVEAEN